MALPSQCPMHTCVSAVPYITKCWKGVHTHVAGTHIQERTTHQHRRPPPRACLLGPRLQPLNAPHAAPPHHQRHHHLEVARQCPGLADHLRQGKGEWVPSCPHPRDWDMLAVSLGWPISCSMECSACTAGACLHMILQVERSWTAGRTSSHVLVFITGSSVVAQAFTGRSIWICLHAEKVLRTRPHLLHLRKVLCQLVSCDDYSAYADNS